MYIRVFYMHICLHVLYYDVIEPLETDMNCFKWKQLPQI